MFDILSKITRYAKKKKENQLIKTDTDIRIRKDIKIVSITVFHMFKNLSKNMKNIFKGPNRTSGDENYSV